MNKVSTLALLAAIGLAAPAFAQTPSDLRSNPFIMNQDSPQTPMQSSKGDVTKDKMSKDKMDKKHGKKHHHKHHHHDDSTTDKMDKKSDKKADKMDKKSDKMDKKDSK